MKKVLFSPGENNVILKILSAVWCNTEPRSDGFNFAVLQ